MTAHLPAMSEFRPITTVADLLLQNQEEISAGYLAGLDGAREPGSDKSRSYWHGWRNGMVESGRRPIDAAQRELQSAIHARRMAH